MAILVPNTSSLVSLGCAEHYTRSALDLLFDGFDVIAPEAVAAELRSLASYEHDHRTAAKAARSSLESTQARTRTVPTISPPVPPLDAGERAAIELSNDEQAEYLLCDEFNNLTLITSALQGTNLLTTPALIAAFVDRGVMEKGDAQEQLTHIASMRSWENNAYYQRMKRLLDQMN